MKKNTTKDTPSKDEPRLAHAVMYTDGSSKPNPGYWGSGVHGYIYLDDDIDKTTGDKPTGYAITNMGYLDKSEVILYKHNNVKPFKYFNSVTSNKEPGTNNTGEIVSIYQAVNTLLELSGENNITYGSITINSDSTYALGIVSTIQKDHNEDWDIDRPNLELWYHMRDMIDTLKEKGIELITRKVLAHSDSIGNNVADRLAYLGRYKSSIQDIGYVWKLVPASKYWKPTFDKNPLLSFKNLFFTNESREKTSNKIYSIMNYGSNVDTGRPSNEAVYGVVMLDKPVVAIDNVIDIHNKYMGALSTIMTIDLSVLYSQKHNVYHGQFGDCAYSFNVRNKTMSVVEEDPITYTVKPAGIANNALKKTVKMTQLLNDYIEDSVENKSRLNIDITNFFYKKNSKDKFICKVSALTKYIKIPITIDGVELPVIIVLGNDTLDRNAIKKFERKVGKVTLLVEIVGDGVANYYTIFESADRKEYGIYCNPYTNKLFYKEK